MAAEVKKEIQLEIAHESDATTPTPIDDV